MEKEIIKHFEKEEWRQRFLQELCHNSKTTENIIRKYVESFGASINNRPKDMQYELIIQLRNYSMLVLRHTNRKLYDEFMDRVNLLFIFGEYKEFVKKEKSQLAPLLINMN